MDDKRTDLLAIGSVLTIKRRGRESPRSVQLIRTTRGQTFWRSVRSSKKDDASCEATRGQTFWRSERRLEDLGFLAWSAGDGRGLEGRCSGVSEDEKSAFLVGEGGAEGGETC